MFQRSLGNPGPAVVQEGEEATSMASAPAFAARPTASGKKVTVALPTSMDWRSKSRAGGFGECSSQGSHLPSTLACLFSIHDPNVDWIERLDCCSPRIVALRFA